METRMLTEADWEPYKAIAAAMPRTDTAERGVAIYARLRPVVETDKNIGKIIAIDVETGDYHIADHPITASKPLHEKRQGARLWGERIGYDAMYGTGGGTEPKRTVK